MYGLLLDGAEVVEVPLELAELFAAAHLRVTGRPAGARGSIGSVATVESPPAAGGAPVEEVVAALESAERPIVLAGPGVVREGAVAGLRALAGAGSLGVLNTWGAKGVFEWTSPHHLATVGLQARDLDLAGVFEADLVLVTGLDTSELPAAPWAFLHGIGGGAGDLQPRALQVAPVSMGDIAVRWGRPTREIPVPPLRSALAEVTQQGWARHDGPLWPSRVTLTYREVLGPDGLVVADPGTAGFWVARTYPTSAVGAAIVPAEVRPGFAAACAVVARIVDPSRAVLFVTDADHPDPLAEAVLAAGDRLGVRVAVERWSVDASRSASGNEGALDADAHAERLRRLLATGGDVTVRTDPSQLERIVRAAGPVVAWGGLATDGVPGGRALGESG